jgi:hypothetical protein
MIILILLIAGAIAIDYDINHTQYNKDCKTKQEQSCSNSIQPTQYGNKADANDLGGTNRKN